jgi:ribosomal protein S18 acetylase RimI-like enzyme
MSNETGFHIEKAKEEDWPWIVQGQAEIAWTRLGPDRQEELGWQTCGASVARQVARIRRDEGFPTATFVARTGDGTRAGFVWVARTHHDFTGQLEATLLGQYVAEAYRHQGLGRLLMARAEEWARQQGLTRISMSVGAHNTLAQKMYETLGFRVESLRMSRDLTKHEDGSSLIDW